MDTKITISVGGMSCAACSAAVERSIKRLDGIKEATVNIATNKAVVIYDSDIIKLSDIKNAIKKAGFKPLETDSENTRENIINQKNTMRSRLVWAVVFGVLLFYVSMGHMIGLPLPEFKP